MLLSNIFSVEGKSKLYTLYVKNIIIIIVPIMYVIIKTYRSLKKTLFPQLVKDPTNNIIKAINPFI